MAVISVVVCLIRITIVNRQVRQAHVDTGKTRPIVDAAVAKIQALHPSSPDAPSFRQALETLPQTQYVFGVWLICPDGQIALPNVGCANSGRIEGWATEATQCVLSEMPEDFLTHRQRIALLATSSI